MKSVKPVSNVSTVNKTYLKSFLSAIERFYSMISVGSILVDDWSPCSLSSFISKLLSSTSSPNILPELFKRTIFDGGEHDTDGYFFFNLLETGLQESLITVQATDLSSALS